MAALFLFNYVFTSFIEKKQLKEKVLFPGILKLILISDALIFLYSKKFEQKFE